MKKVLFLVVAGLLAYVPAYAGDMCSHHENCAKKMEQKGGFMGEPMKPMSVAEVQKLPEDTKVAVEGYLTERVDDEEYMFTDGTNDILVEIEDKKWRGQVVSPKDKVYLKGKVEHKHDRPLIDVKAIRLVK